MPDLKAPGFAIRSTGAIRAAGPVVASVLDADEIYADFDATGLGYARVGVKRNGAGTSGGVKIRTLNAGAAVDAVTFAANGYPTFGNGTASVLSTFNGINATGFAGHDYQATGVSKWLVGRGVANLSNDYQIYNSVLAAVAMNIDSATSAVTLGATIATADPGGGVGAWKLGKYLAAAVALDATHYVQVMVDGTLRKLLVAT